MVVGSTSRRRCKLAPYDFTVHERCMNALGGAVGCSGVGVLDERVRLI